MFFVIEKTLTSQSKKRFESCYETFIDFMIYSVSLFQTEILSSYQQCDKESRLVYQQSIILRSMINQSESIKTSNANLESTVITCRMIERNDFS